MPKTYCIKADRTAADVVKNNDITLETGYKLEEARIASLEYQRQGGHVAVWIEEEPAPKTPRITRSI
jgi:hypothetical protein